MTKMFDLLGFAVELKSIEKDLQAAGPKIVRRACEMLEKKCKGAIGRQHEEWPDLAPSTIEDKARKGFKTPAPLLRTSEFKNSIGFTIAPGGLEGTVGTDDPRGPWFEYGTSKMPPRSWLVGNAIALEPRIQKMADATTAAALSGHGRNVHDVREMLELLHRAGHALKELGEDLLGDDEEGNDK
jgi:hypothetical protein